ncbi:MAG: glycerophosphodiester phosphodiesterase [Chloroflexota bacterium]
MLRKLLKGLGYLILGLIAIVAIVLGIMIAISRPMPDHPFFANLPDDEFIILAHQGGDGEFPGNTMVAFQNAVDVGAHVLELDAHTSADGVIVVIHDATVNRTTDGTGRVNEMTFADLQALDAGYNFPTLAGHELEDTGEFPFQGQDITIPSLEEVFQTFPEMPISVEIKQEIPSMAQALCDLIREYEREELTIVPSFSPIAINEFREVCPEVATTAVEPEVIQFFALSYVGIGKAWNPNTEAFMIPETQGGLTIITQRFVDQLHGRNVRLYPWTINTQEQMQRMFDYGVDGIITDYPTLALEMSR